MVAGTYKWDGKGMWGKKWKWMKVWKNRGEGGGWI